MLRYCTIRALTKLPWALPACCLLLFHIQAYAQAPGQAAASDSIADRAVPCMACHGKEGRATGDGSFPRIAGKPAGYLYNQLRNFRDGRRKHGQMTYMVATMSDRNLQEFADYFAGLHPPYPAPQAPDVGPSELEHGRALVMQGDAGRNIPACSACHGEKLTGTQPSIPGLAGLSRGYLSWQFGSWKTGTRKAAAPDCMGQIAQRLTAQDIGALTAWIAAQKVPDDMSAAPSGTIKLPIACGSYAEKP